MLSMLLEIFSKMFLKSTYQIIAGKKPAATTETMTMKDSTEPR